MIPRSDSSATRIMAYLALSLIGFAGVLFLLVLLTGLLIVFMGIVDKYVITPLLIYLDLV